MLYVSYKKQPYSGANVCCRWHLGEGGRGGGQFTIFIDLCIYLLLRYHWMQAFTIVLHDPAEGSPTELVPGRSRCADKKGFDEGERDERCEKGKEGFGHGVPLRREAFNSECTQLGAKAKALHLRQGEE